MRFFKNSFFITVTIGLAVALEAMTISSLQEFNTINNSFQEASSKYKNYGKDVTLSEIKYSEAATQELMQLVVNNDIETFKTIANKNFIQEIYQKNQYTPIWFNDKGIKQDSLNELCTIIQADITLDENGPVFKRSQELQSLLSTNPKLTLQQQLYYDLQLSSLYKSYVSYHLYGAIEWKGFEQKLATLRRNKMNADWVTNTPKYNIAELMFAYPLSHIIAVTTPNSFGYQQLLSELRRLKKIQKQGGWKKLSNSPQLRYGKSGALVKQLTERLESSGDYRCQHNGATYTYDQCLQKAVKQFQIRHGISASGSINNYTISKLNLPVEWKINKVLLNIDRIKRLPDQPEDRYIMVNIPDFKLYYKENGQEKLSMRVIVGDKEHHTPIFSNAVSYIVLNPYWIIPDTIAKQEVIPEMIKNPNYLAQKGYEVRKDFAFSRPPLDCNSINWSQVLRNKQSNEYKFVQPPGPNNALGKIKFKFPNQFAVYMHDTPTKNLFKKGERAFSHGCIRVADPEGLLATFAPHERSVNYDRAQAILKGKTKTQLNLSERVPVHIVYLTAWINSDGLLHYRNDVYNYDSKQIRSIE